MYIIITTNIKTTNYEFPDCTLISKACLLYSAVPIYEFDDISKRNKLLAVRFCFLGLDGKVYIAEMTAENNVRPKLREIINFVYGVFAELFPNAEISTITQLTNHGALLFSMMADFRELYRKKFYYIYQNKEPVVHPKKIKITASNKDIIFSSYDTLLYGAKYTTDTLEIINYFCSFTRFCREDLSVNIVPSNIPKLAEQYIYNLSKEKGISSEEITGTAKTEYEEYINGRKQRTTKSLIAENDGIMSDYLVQNCFSGGYNCCFVYGNYTCRDDEIIIDCDLSSCYPTALAAKNNADYKNIKSSFNTNNINSTKDIGSTGNIGSMGIISTPDDTEITSLEDLSDDLKHALSDVTKYCFCYCKFTFDDDVLYPTLPVRGENKDKGLYYVTSGLSFCTGAELLTTLLYYRHRVRIQIKNIVVIGTNENNIYYDAYKKLLCMRKEARTNGETLKAETIKNICNTGYGKTAQGITSDSNISKITNVLYAADATGTARAVLNTLISIFAKHNYKIIDVITDGLKVVIPKPKNFEQLYDTENNKLKIEDIDHYLSEELLTEINSNIVIQLFKNTNNRLTDCNDNSYIKVKHIGDSINYYHNKCYVMRYKGEIQHKISSGIKTETGEEIDIIFSSDKIEPRQYKHEITLTELLSQDNKDNENNKGNKNNKSDKNNNGDRNNENNENNKSDKNSQDKTYSDIYTILKEITPTIAPDSKRRFCSKDNISDNISSFPWYSVNEAVNTDTYIQDRKKSRNKKITTPEDIEFHQNKKEKKHKINTKEADKILWRAITQRKGIFSELLQGISDKEIKEKLKLSKDNFNNAKRKLKFEPNVIVDTPENRKIIASVCSMLQIDLSEHLKDIYEMMLIR